MGIKCSSRDINKIILIADTKSCKLLQFTY